MTNPQARAGEKNTHTDAARAAEIQRGADEGAVNARKSIRGAAAPPGSRRRFRRGTAPRMPSVFKGVANLHPATCGIRPTRPDEKLRFQPRRV